MLLVMSVAGALFLAFLVLLVGKIIANRVAIIRFKQLTKGLPVCPEARLFGNHISTVMVGENNCEKLQMWHEKLGKTIGFLKGSQYCVSTIDLNLIKRFIHDEPDIHMNRTNMQLPFEEFEKSIMFAPKEEWRQLRPVIGPALASNKFKTPNVQREIEQSITKLVQLIDKQIAINDTDYLFDVDRIMSKFSLDLIFRCFFKQEGLIDFDNPKDPVSRATEHGYRLARTSLFIRFALTYPILRGLLDWLALNFLSLLRYRRNLREYVVEQATLGLKARKQLEKMKADAEKTGAKINENDFVLEDGTRFRRNMIDYVIDKYIDGKLTRGQYINNGAFLFSAADKTVTDTVVHTIYLLSIDQDVQTRLRKSIMMDGLESQFLDWVIKESLRLLPPIPGGCSRTIERDIEVEGGYVLPAGTLVLTCAYVIHRLKEYWGDDADEFRPERWRDTNHHHPFQYIPFGAGPRACPGKMFAMHEMKILFTTLLTRYKFEGSPRDDAYKFDSPFFIYLLPHSLTRVLIKHLNECPNT